MNGKFEDQLAQLAFGEITGAEAARIEAQAAADPEALRVLATYRSMKGGLGDLTEVPEDQLSKERLRHAILMGGLKPKPVEKASPFGWLWMPASAFVLAAAFMMFNGQRGSGVEPMVTVNDADVASPSIEFKVPETYDFSSSGYSVKVEPKKTPTAVARVEKPRERVRRSRVAREDLAPIELVDFGSSRKFKSDLMVNIDKESRIPTVSVDTAEMQEPAAAPATIVIIEENRDESTGAYRATEVGTASNVLIGG